MATTYYVNNSGGNDTSTGTSQSTAWKTLAKVSGVSFSPGDSVLFNKGDVWRETLEIPSAGTLVNYITFGNYGTGINPRILGSTATTTWTDQGGNIWKTDLTFIDPRSIYPNYEDIVFNTGGVERFGAYVANVGALLAEYNWTWSANYIYIYAISNPGTRYTGVEVQQRRFGISTNNYEYLDFNGIDVFYCGDTGYDTNADHGDNVNITNCIIENCEVGFIGGVTGQQYGYGIALCYSNLIVRHCTIHHCGRRSISINMLYTASPWTVKNILVEDCIFHHGSHTTSIDITVNNGGDSASIDGFIFRRNYVWEDPNDYNTSTSRQIWLQRYGTTASVGIMTNFYIYNNIFKYTDSDVIGMEGQKGNFYIYNNTFYENISTGTSYGIYFDTDRGTCYVYIKNNIFYTTLNSDAGGRGAAIVMLVPSSYYICNYNLFYRINNSLRVWFINGTSNYLNQISTVRSSYGWETNGSTGNPLFNSTTDYHLQSTSPARGMGIYLYDSSVLNTDYEGNIRNNPPSLGAYEYVRTTYYVTSAGSDSSDGLTQATAWQTLTKAQSTATTPGSIIALKKGDTWSLNNVLDVSHGGSAGNLIIWDGSVWGNRI